VNSSTNSLARTTSQMGLYGSSIDTNTIGYALWNDQVYDALNGSVCPMKLMTLE
jgi:hypothetical protein